VRIKWEACGGVEPAMKWRVLKAEDAPISAEDTEAQHERDLALFRGWHRRRGTDPKVALRGAEAAYGEPRPEAGRGEWAQPGART
jgi:hypothetical protein